MSPVDGISGKNVELNSSAHKAETKAAPAALQLLKAGNSSDAPTQGCSLTNPNGASVLDQKATLLKLFASRASGNTDGRIGEKADLKFPLNKNSAAIIAGEQVQTNRQETHAGLEALFGKRIQLAPKNENREDIKTAPKKWATVQTEEKSATSIVKELSTNPALRAGYEAIKNNADNGVIESKFGEIIKSFESAFDRIEEPAIRLKTVVGFYLMHANAGDLAKMDNHAARSQAASYGLTFHPERYNSEEVAMKYVQNATTDYLFGAFDACKQDDVAAFFNNGFSMACFEDSVTTLTQLITDKQSAGETVNLKASIDAGKGIEEIGSDAFQLIDEFENSGSSSFANWACDQFGITGSGRETMNKVEQYLKDLALL